MISVRLTDVSALGCTCMLGLLCYILKSVMRKIILFFYTSSMRVRMCRMNVDISSTDDDGVTTREQLLKTSAILFIFLFFYRSLSSICIFPNFICS